VAYNCLPSDEPAVETLLPNLGPYDRLKQGMLCEQLFMVSWQCFVLSLISRKPFSCLFQNCRSLRAVSELVHMLVCSIRPRLGAGLLCALTARMLLSQPALHTSSSPLLQTLAANMTHVEFPPVVGLPFGAN
jgi:hypothetical protein